MDSNMIVGVLVLIVLIILGILKKKAKNTRKKQNKGYQIHNDYIYSKKPLMTNTERYFYNIMVSLEAQYKIKVMPQVNLASVVLKKNKNYYVNELFRNVDFGIFNSDYSELLLLIEINDSTHNQRKRIRRDKNVDDIVNNAGINLIKFYTKYPNEVEYVKNRILKELGYKQ